jgi:hypothetical protein
MLIDKSHKSWIVWSTVIGLFALALYLFLYRQSPEGLTGGTTVGLCYGIIGSALMIYAGLLSAHRKVPRWALLPSRAWMLKGHIWLGLLSLVFILCHSGFHWGGTLEVMLWVVFGLTLATGIVGLALQQVVPRLLTTRLAEEVPYEQIPYILQALRAEADRLVDEISGPQPEAPARALAGASGSDKGPDAGPGSALKLEVRAYYDREARPFLGPRNGAAVRPRHIESQLARFRDTPDLAGVREQLEKLRTLCSRRRDIAEQERFHHLLHVWLVVHVPLAVALLVLGTAHAVLSTYY